MATPEHDKLRIHVNIEISTVALQAIVANAKRMAARGPNGAYHVDTADKVSEMVSRFLEENDFESFVNDIENYTISDSE
jgi:hypothetical protein